MKLYRRGKTYWVMWGKDGKMFRQSLRTKSRTEALRMLDGMAAASRASSFQVAVEIMRIYFDEVGERTPLEKAWEVYEQVLRGIGRDEIAETTLRHRRQYFNRFLEWAGKSAPSVSSVEQVDAKTAAAFAEFLAASKSQRGTPLAKKTRKEILDELRGVWNVLAKRLTELKNPWLGLTPSGATVEGVRRAVFTPDEERRVMEAAAKVGKGWPLACLIARHTGLRYGSVANLLWEEIDLEHGVLRHVPRKTARHGIEVEIPLVKELWDALKAARAEAQGNPHVLPFHAVVYGMNNRQKSKQLPFREVLDAAGIEGEEYTFHSWRHTAASRLAHVGADMETRKRILGHTTDAMAEHYDQDGHLDEKRRALEAAAKVR